MAISPAWRKTTVSLLFLVAAFLVAAVIATLPNGLPPTIPDDQGGHSLLMRRVSANWGQLARKAFEQDGKDGLVALDTFGDEAAHCLEHNKGAFKDLVQVVRLDATQFRLATGPWHRAVLDWAQNGHLPRYLKQLQSLPPNQLAIAEATPAALPLLCESKIPTAHAMLEKHGIRVLPLFSAVNFIKHPEDVERIAQAVETEDDLILRICETYGLGCALLLVPPETGKGSQVFPKVVKYALRTLEDEPTALALMMTNYDAIRELLDEGATLRQLEEAIDLFKVMPPVVREVALDHSQTIRLLSEKWYGQRLGAVILQRCGPKAADVIYKHYGKDDKVKLPALVALAKVGEPALEVLQQYQGYGKFHALLRRSNEGLLSPEENPPAVAHAVYNVKLKGQSQIDIYAEVLNLKGQVLKDVRGPLPEEAYLEWVPGYIAYRTAANYADGQYVTGGDVFWATVDGVSTATLVYGVVANGVKTVGVKAGQKAGVLVAENGVIQAERVAAKKVVQQTEQQVGKSLERLAVQALKQEGAHLERRLGAEAGSVYVKRLEAQTQGLMLELTDQRNQFVKLAKAGDISGKARLVEEIGEEGARKYARQVRYDPLYEGKPGKGMGFDQVYRDGERIKVIEAKGGGSPLRTYRGHEQGSLEYTKEVAEWTIRSPATDAKQKDVAKEVLQAAKEGRLDVEVVQTLHDKGRPTSTRVVQSFGPNGSKVPTITEIRSTLMRGPGVAGAWLRSMPASVSTMDLRNWLKGGEAVARRTGISLWHEGTGPCMDRVVVRGGSKHVSSIGTLSVQSRNGGVDDFVVALMERGM